MSISLADAKDFLLVTSPIIIAYISYRTNRKSAKEIQLDIEKTLKEKDAETNQILTKINAELESQKELISWQHSQPQTEKYIEEIGLKRYSNICNLPSLIAKINLILQHNNLKTNELEDIKSMLLKIDLPKSEEELYPYEIPILIEFNKLFHTIEQKLEPKI